MKFLLDVNAGGMAADWLSQRGHDVARVSDVDPRMCDNGILEWAVREGRVIVTTDHDFEEMIWKQGRRHCGILRLENVPRDQRRRLLDTALAGHEVDLAPNGFLIRLYSFRRVTAGRHWLCQC
jgi:predicted nuclease of predicted toxin-antitoxin system